MNRSFTLAAIVIALCSFSLQTMAQAEVSGQVRDSVTREALSFCNVSALNRQDSLVAGGITDDNGFFRISLNPGPYRLIISFVGYRTDTLQLMVGTENKYLGTIRLKQGLAELGEVLVKGATRGYTIKKIINAQGYDMADNDFWLAFIQQPLLKNSLTVMVGYILPVNFGVSYNQGSYTDTGLYTTTSLYNIGMLRNMLLVNITYRFNQGKSVRNIEKDVKSEVERKAKKLF
jgi:hypothetical protein